MGDIETAARIKLRAHDLVMQYGIRSVSMDDIAGALGMSKKTIYQYYSDKDQLIEEIIKDKVEESRLRCLEDKNAAKDAVHEVFMAMEMMQVMFQEMNPSVVHDMEKFHPKAHEHFLKHKYDFLYQVLTQNIQRGIAEGLYRPEVNADIIVKARLENLLLSFNQRVYPKNKYSIVEVEIQLTEHFLFGLTSQKGHKLILKYQQERLKKEK